jgi:hypothetical protein
MAKYRSGFVSNSSSSSFIVRFDSIPTSVEEVQEVLFGDEIVYINPYPWEDVPKYWAAEQVANIVWEDMKDDPPNNAESIRESIGDYWEFSESNKDKFKLPRGKFDWDASAIAEDKYNEKLCEQWLEGGGYTYTFSYADDDTLGSAMEHGTLFDRLDHKKISNH